MDDSLRFLVLLGAAILSAFFIVAALTRALNRCEGPGVASENEEKGDVKGRMALVEKSLTTKTFVAPRIDIADKKGSANNAAQIQTSGASLDGPTPTSIAADEVVQPTSIAADEVVGDGNVAADEVVGDGNVQPDPADGGCAENEPDNERVQTNDVGEGSIDSQMECHICLCDYEDGQDICYPANGCCRHVFHKDCISQWLLKNDECPCCRARYVGDEELKSEDTSMRRVSVLTAERSSLESEDDDIFAMEEGLAQ